MTAYTDNLHQSPEIASVDSPSPGEVAEVNWKSILKCWELLRLP
jgi:hypothetical protein